jgi:hypothetical protein
MAATAVLLISGAAQAQWSTAPDSLSAYVPTGIPMQDAWAPVYYHFADTTDSGWLALRDSFVFSICLDGNTASTSAGATVKIRRSVTAATVNGSVVLLGRTLTGDYPNACIYDVVGGESIMVDVQANAGSVAAVVSVRRQ